MADVVHRPVEHVEHELDIQRRAFAFAVRVVKLVRALGSDTAAQSVARQVMRSGTSIAANIEEAQGAHTKREFTHKMNIARAEAFETRFWLRLIVASGLLPRPQLALMTDEADEFVRILTAIVKNARVRQAAAEA
jgi:four helix bundle protein